MLSGSFSSKNFSWIKEEMCEELVSFSYWSFSDKIGHVVRVDVHMTQLQIGGLLLDHRHLPGSTMHSQRMSGRSYRNRLQGNTPILCLLRTLHWNHFLYAQMEQLSLGRKDLCMRM